MKSSNWNLLHFYFDRKCHTDYPATEPRTLWWEAACNLTLPIQQLRFRTLSQHVFRVTNWVARLFQMKKFSFHRRIHMAVREKSLQPLDACANCTSISVRRSGISLRSVHSGSATHHSSHSVGSRPHFQGIRRPWREVNLSSPPSRADVGMCPTHLYDFQIKQAYGYVSFLYWYELE